MRREGSLSKATSNELAYKDFILVSAEAKNKWSLTVKKFRFVGSVSIHSGDPTTGQL
jgi:hypothetical protein